MKNLTRFGVFGMLLLSFFPLHAQQPRVIVHITVIQDGHQRPAPAEITVSFGSRLLRIPVREGKFEVPPEVVAAKTLLFETDVNNSHIRLIHVTGEDFTQEDWTLRVAEHANEDYYDWPGPRGAYIPTTCMLEFESIHTDPGRILFEQNCRSKKNKQGMQN